MMKFRTKILLLFLLLFCGTMSLFADRKISSKQILFITSYDGGCHWTAAAEKSFCSYFKTSSNGDADIDLVELGVKRNPGLVFSEENVAVFRKKMAQKKYDIIVTLGNAATNLVFENAKLVPRETRFIYSGYAGMPKSLHARQVDSTGLLLPRLLEKNMHLATSLFPNIRKIAVVTDGTAFGTRLNRIFQEEAVRIKGPEFEFLNGGNIGTEEMLFALMQLPPESVVLYAGWRSSKGEGFTPDEILVRKIVAARRPVFYMTDVPEESGFVGGYFVSGDACGTATGRLVESVLAEEKAAAVPPQVLKPGMQFDWNVLKNWELNPRLLPSQAKFLNRPEPFLEKYIPELIASGILLLLVLLSILRGSLMRRHYRKKINGLFSALPIHVGVADRKGRILFYQTGGQSASSRRPSRLAELPLELQREIEEPIREAFRTGMASQKLFDAFGRFRHLDFIPLASGIFGRTCVMWIITDVTELQTTYSAVSQLAERFRLTLESIADAVIVTDGEENIAMMNPVAVKMIGCDPKQGVGKRLNEVFHITTSEYSFKNSETPLTVALRTRKELKLSNDTTLHSGDGRMFRISLCASPIREEDTSISGAVLFFRDMSDEYEKREILCIQNAILRNAAEVMNIVYFCCGPDGAFFPLGNDFALNWKMRDGVPVPPEQWIAANDLPIFQDQFTKFLSGELNTICLTYHSREELGDSIYEIRISESSRDGAGCFYGTIQDITESYLQKEWLENAVDVAQKAEQIKKSFIASTNKMLSPLHAVLEFSEHLCNDHLAREEFIKNLQTLKLAGQMLLNSIKEQDLPIESIKLENEVDKT